MNVLRLTEACAAAEGVIYAFCPENKHTWLSRDAHVMFVRYRNTLIA